MNTEIKKIVDNAIDRCLCDELMNHRDIVTLLETDSLSPEGAYIREKAHEAAMKITGEKACLWGAMGIDFVPCPVSCDFCSFGEKWGIVKEKKIYSLEEIKHQMREFVDHRVHFVVIRTTEFYNIDDLCEKVRSLKSEIHGNYEIILNIGEFEYEDACKMWEAGVSGIYHACRLREGIDTGISPERRNRTMEAVRKSPLKLISLVEPIGEEHTAEEIADNFLNIAAHEAVITGVMARSPVPGTPLGDRFKMISKDRIAHITAVLRLAAGSVIPDICVHPASMLALDSGANLTVIETGAIPRDNRLIKDEWKQFTAETAIHLFEKAGYAIQK